MSSQIDQRGFVHVTPQPPGEGRHTRREFAHFLTMLLVLELQLQMRARSICNRRSFDPSAAAETLLIMSPSKSGKATRGKDTKAVVGK